MGFSQPTHLAKVFFGDVNVNKIVNSDCWLSFWGPWLWYSLLIFWIYLSLLILGFALQWPCLHSKTMWYVWLSFHWFSLKFKESFPKSSFSWLIPCWVEWLSWSSKIYFMLLPPTLFMGQVRINVFIHHWKYQDKPRHLHGFFSGFSFCQSLYL